MEVDSKTKRAFTRSQHTASLSAHNKSALTDHATQENHVINWVKEAVIDTRVPPSHHVDQGSCTYPQGSQQAMNRDEGSYQLSHAYDHFLDTVAVHVRIQKN